MKILLIEDNETILQSLEYTLTKNKFEVEKASTIKAAIEKLQTKNIDLIILDISLPDGNGFELYKNKIKELKIDTIFLTAIDEEEKIVETLNLGAEDYITKPFSISVLLAKINKIKMRKEKNSIIEIEKIKFDIDKMEVYKEDKKIELTSLELKILHLLFINKNRVVTRDLILDKIWDWTGNDVDDHTITVYLKRIREKLDSNIITTVKGIGYRIDKDGK